MKYSIPLWSLFFICFSEQILGAKDVPYAEPFMSVLLDNYKKDCHLTSEDFKQMGAIFKCYRRISRGIWFKLAKEKQEDLLDTMCYQDGNLKSAIANRIKDICVPKSPQSDMVDLVVKRVCGGLMPTIFQNWALGNTIIEFNPLWPNITHRESL